MTELSLPLAHPSSLPTTTSDQRRDRGNISILVLLWLSFAAISCVVITHATSVLLSRAQLQASADAVALALASRNERAAHTMADHMHVTIITMSQQQKSVFVTVRSSAGTASAQALRSSYEFEP